MAETAELRECKLPKRLPWQHRVAEALEGPARFVVVVMGRRAGKTTVAADIAGEYALDRKGEVFWGAPTHDLASVGMEKFREFYGPALERAKESPPVAETLTGGRVIWRSFERGGAAIGRGFDLAIIDEAARVKRQMIYEDLLPTLADRGGKALAITTPRGRRNWVFEWSQKAKQGDPLYAVIHGPTTENPAPDIQEFCEMARENMPDALYRQEILGEFVEGDGSVFRNVGACAVEPAWLETPEPGRRYVVGCDLAKHQDWTVLTAIDIDSGRVVNMDRFNRIDWEAIEARVRSYGERWSAPVMLDATGVGDPVFDRLVSSGANVIPFKFTNESKSNIVVALMNAIEKAEISFPPDPVLLGELEAFTYQELPSGKFRYSAPDGLHDDCVMALALGVWARNRNSGPIVDWV